MPPRRHRRQLNAGNAGGAPAAPVLGPPAAILVLGPIATLPDPAEYALGPGDVKGISKLCNTEDYQLWSIQMRGILNVFVGKLRYLKARMAAAGFDIPDTMLATRLAAAVPAIYTPIVEGYFGSTANDNLNNLAGVIRTAES
ncbi:hypothetical protein TWF481_002886 [Arthrobotrys musiformis]|uniref:Retrotransposon Copia-like N-terminal domain-containing protein n=1 Tax=Arthrobotrys musiformis TaxID=47236 RepID=A0AAV9VRJ4_9PEZI